MGTANASEVSDSDPEADAEVVVRVHAVMRRLRAEYFDREEIMTILASRAKVAKLDDLIREEYLVSQELSAEARRIFIHPFREKHLDKRSGAVNPKQERHGRRATDVKQAWRRDTVVPPPPRSIPTSGLDDIRSFREELAEAARQDMVVHVNPRVERRLREDHPFRRQPKREPYAVRRFKRKDGRYRWSGRVVYVEDHNCVVTAIVPDKRQLETLFDIMPELREFHVRERPFQAELERVREDEPRPRGPRNQTKAKPQWFKREKPEVPRWLKKAGAEWTILVLDAMAEGRWTSPRQAARRAFRWLRRKAGKRDLDIHVEGVGDPVFRSLEMRLGTSKLRARQIALPRINWNRVAEKVPGAAKRWWENMATMNSYRNLLLVLTPESAKAVLEIVDGGSEAAWRKQALRNGTVVSIRLQQAKGKQETLAASFETL